MAIQATEETEEGRSGPCRVIDSLERVGSQWCLVPLHGLQEGKGRFDGLKQSTDAGSRTRSRVLDDNPEVGFTSRRIGSEPSVFEGPPVAGGWR